MLTIYVGKDTREKYFFMKKKTSNVYIRCENFRFSTCNQLKFSGEEKNQTLVPNPHTRLEWLMSW